MAEAKNMFPECFVFPRFYFLDSFRFAIFTCFLTKWIQVMDSAKIESVFESLKKKKLLTSKGALYMGGSIMTLISASLLASSCFLYVKGELGDVLVSVVLAAFIFFVCVALFPSEKFYQDRMDLSYLCGLYNRKFYYTDLKKVTFTKQYNRKEKAWVKTLSVFFKGKDVAFNERTGNTKKFEGLIRLFCSGFKPLFVNEFYYKEMMQLFAYVISLRSDSQYQSVETQCALKYLSESKYAGYNCREDISEQLRLYNKHRQANKLPADMGYINVCLAIMQDKGVDYADRLELLTHLFECAYASDGAVDEEELDYLSRIAYYFCIKDWDLLSLKYQFEAVKQEQYGGQTESDAYAKQRERYRSVCASRKREAYNLLGVSAGASLEEVKSAYRTLVKSCHPDTLPPTATEAEREEAAIRFRAVTEAYDFLCAELAAEPVSVAR